MKTKKLLKYDWKFAKQHIENGWIPENAEDAVFCPVVIPHDWLIGQAEDLYEDSVGWYCRKIRVDHAGEKRYFLRFEGVYMDCLVYVNGKTAGEWKYGYTTFELEITDLVKNGENEVLVRVIHQCPNSRWYTGAGIYRPVWLIEREPVHFAADGIYIHTEKTETGYETQISAEITLPEQGNESLTEDTDSAGTASCSVNFRLFDREGICVGEAFVSGIDFTKGSKEKNGESCTEAGRRFLAETVITVENPTEWSVEAPHRYRLRAELSVDGSSVDREEIYYGYRTLVFSCDKGFFLNGKHVKLKGVCLHHDLGCLGSAVNKNALRRQLAMMQEMGANSIRTAHNMPSVELMELADEMGILILSESFDCWKNPKNPYDYARFFEEWEERDVRNWIRRDRNHPSVIMWSVGNEIYDTHADERGQETLRMLMRQVAEHDPKKNAPVTLGSNFMPWENTQKCADIVKLIGYNYAEKLYEEHHEKHPDWIIYGSETASVVQSRGIYHFPYEKEILADDDEQCSSLGNSITSWGAPSLDFCVTKERDTEFSLGQFLWAGIDYLGEPTPYHGRNSYFGMVDTAGFKKDAFFIFQAGWTDHKTAPMVHIFPYWDFNPGQLIDVRVASNAPEVELFFNDISLGKKKIDHVHGEKLTADWQIIYEPGELLALAYDENGAVIAQDKQCSFGDAAELVLSADRSVICADDEELVFITVSAKDKDGNPVENANNRVKLFVEGAGILAGLDNGDSTDSDQYQTDSKCLFSGKLLAVVRSTGAAGEIKIMASSPGVKSAELVIMEEKVRKKPIEWEHPHCSEAVPVRKIELLPLGPTVLNAECSVTRIRAVCHPADAGIQELTFRVTDAAGVDSTFASIEADKENPQEAVITVRGDGEFYVRCMCKNGKKAYALISLLEYRAEGLGVRNLNPYEFLSASLYSQAGGGIGNGNERGISTQRDGISWVAYENLDFGEFGSEEVTIPVFSFGGTTPFTFWEGIPYAEGSRIIGRRDYTKPGVWNTYIEDTFTLDKRLRGITTFAVELDRKIHMKGFSFTKQEKAFSRLCAAEADSIYGDSYKKQDTAIHGIGNNVTLAFSGMDFGDIGAEKLIICGKTSHEVNNIRLLTEYEDGRKETESLEFPYAESNAEVIFSIKRKQGKAKVSFVFLPGSAFDFEWFVFVKGSDIK